MGCGVTNRNLRYTPKKHHFEAIFKHECHDDALCFNTDGSYDCVCRAGTFGDGWDICITEYCPDGWYGPNSTFCFKIPDNAQASFILVG